MHYFKLFAEFATDPKVQSLSEPMQRRLVMLLCLRCIGPLEGMAGEEIATFLRLTESDLAETKAVFVRKGFIRDDWTVVNWDKRQSYDGTAAARMRASRERKRNASATEAQQTRNGDVTSPNCCATELELELELEKTHSPLPPQGGKCGFDLPDWIPAEAWSDFEASRKATKHPLHDGARRQVVKRLAGLRDAGHDPAKLLDLAVERGWRTVYVPEEGPYQARGAAREYGSDGLDYFDAGARV